MGWEIVNPMLHVHIHVRVHVQLHIRVIVRWGMILNCGSGKGRGPRLRVGRWSGVGWCLLEWLVLLFLSTANVSNPLTKTKSKFKTSTKLKNSYTM